MKFLSFFIPLFFLLSCQTKPVSKSQPRLTEGTFTKSSFIQNKNYKVYLPKTYSDNPKKKYPVLYMMDAQNLFVDSLSYSGAAWNIHQVVDQLVEKKAIPEIIIVALEHASAKRFSEYMPQKPIAALPKTQQAALQNIIQHPIYSDDFLKFLVQDFKPFIDNNYRTKAEIQHTFIGGSSMGGLISMYAQCEYPKVFGGAMCLSTHWIVSFDDSNPEVSKELVQYFSNNLPEGKKWYFDFGTKGLDQFYEPWQNKIDSVLQQNNYVKSKNWLTKKYEGHGHNESSWNERLHVPLTFLLEEK